MKVDVFDRVQQGLKALGNSACSMRQNLEQRIQNPVAAISGIMSYSQHVWHSQLYSKTFMLCGGKNEDNRRRFKIDHTLPVHDVVAMVYGPDGSIPLDENRYIESQGTEFITIVETNIEGGLNPYQQSYAIRADKYDKIRELLNQGKCPKDALEEAGGFKIWQCLTPEEAAISDGWLELAVGKNRACEEEYAEASVLLTYYVLKAKEDGCFMKAHRGMDSGRSHDLTAQWGMQLAVHTGRAPTGHDIYGIKPLYLGNVHRRSEIGGFHFGSSACFIT